MTGGGDFQVTGPKGGPLTKHASPGRIARLMPGWVRRFKRVTVSKATSPAPHPVLTGRQLIVQFCHWAIANTLAIHYAEIRPIPHKATLPMTTDCSGFATLCYELAGAPDPNGNGYDNGRTKATFTGSLLGHLKHIPLAQLRPGDLAVFGCKSIPTGHHVAVVTAVKGRSYAGVELASHGSENGPLPTTVAVEAQYQPDGIAGVVFLTDPTLT